MMRPLRWLWWDLCLWFKERRERIAIFVAWRLPRQVRYWVTIRACVDATPDDKSPDQVNTIDVLRAFE